MYIASPAPPFSHTRGARRVVTVASAAPVPFMTKLVGSPEYTHTS